MKLSKFTNIAKSESAYIIHNALYNSLVKVNNPILKAFIDRIEDGNSFEYDPRNDFQCMLKTQKMIVEEGVNENNIVNYYARKREKDPLQIIMVVTRNCNFRCPYCYQEHENKKRMSEELLDRVRLAIIKKVEEEKYKEVEIAWFGGEPTLELKNIIPFMKKLRDDLPKDISLLGQMTTNAYLLNIKNLQELVSVGITRYQITLDGLAETHDTTRVLEGNLPTWSTIIKNLNDAKKSNLKFSFTIRTNFTAKIVENAREWFWFLKENFSEDNRFSFYFESVKDLGGLKEKGYKLDYVGDEAVDASSQLMEIAKDIGLEFKSFYRRISPFGMQCYAANKNSYTIDYDGIIKKCTVSFERPQNAVGEVREEGFYIDEGKFAWWSDYDHYDQCKKCSIYPCCYAEKCPNSYFQSAACQMFRGIYFDTLRMFM